MTYGIAVRGADVVSADRRLGTPPTPLGTYLQAAMAPILGRVDEPGCAPGWWEFVHASEASADASGLTDARWARRPIPLPSNRSGRWIGVGRAQWSPSANELADRIGCQADLAEEPD